MFYRLILDDANAEPPILTARELYTYRRDNPSARYEPFDYPYQREYVGEYKTRSDWRQSRYGYVEAIEHRVQLFAVTYGPATYREVERDSRVILRREDGSEELAQPWYGGTRTRDPQVVATYAKLIAKTSAI